MPTILIIEERPVDRTFLTTLLATAGYDVLSASDGEEGLGLLVQRRPDLVISDILMPTANGDEFVHRMRDIPGFGSTPVILYTATYREREARALGSRCGVVDILSSPIASEVVLARVRAAVGLGLARDPTAADPRRVDEAKLSVGGAYDSTVLYHGSGPKADEVVQVERPGVQPPARGGAETVLVIEDEEAVRCLIRVLLERAGYRVIDAECADQGESLFLENPGAIDLVISDVVMPGTSGPSLLKKLMAHHPGLKALFISGYPAGDSGYLEEETEEDSLLTGEFAFLQKPFSAVSLVRKVRQVLDR